MDMSVCGSSSAGMMKYSIIIIITFFPKFSYYFVDLVLYHVCGFFNLTEHPWQVDKAS